MNLNVCNCLCSISGAITDCSSVYTSYSKNAEKYTINHFHNRSVFYSDKLPWLFRKHWFTTTNGNVTLANTDNELCL